MLKKSLILTAVVIIVLTVSLVIYLRAGHSENDYLTIAELKAQGASISERQIRVKGEVAWLRWDARQQTMSFRLTDGENTLEALYRGVVPDDFKPGTKLIIEGGYNTSGIFEVRSISSGNSRLCAVCH